jgi:hypothetical protein
MKQRWTPLVLSLLPATCAEINKDPRIAAMNVLHRYSRRARQGQGWAQPVNSMAYDTLYRLRKQGRVVRLSNGVYRLVTQDEYMYTKGEYEC